MSNRWKILALLFGVRVAMAFQFQAVAALSPFMMESYGIGLADIGLLIGLYLSPGIVFALPGGEIGRWFGDKRAVAFGMVLMLAGGVLVALFPDREAQIAGRVVAGIGGVILNVLMSKMVTDWFRDRDLATAMGIFVNSWPVGIAAALLVLPVVAERAGLSMALVLVVILVAAGLAALVALYRVPHGHEPHGRDAPAAVPASPPGGGVLAGIVVAGAIWGLYNSGLAMVFGFGPAMLVERGWDAPTASFATSIALWIVSLSVPLGGYIADRTGRRDMVLVAGLVGFGGLLWLAPETDAVVTMFVALGLVGGIAAGPIMSLPADILAPSVRARGMGGFFTVYYLSIFVAPAAAGLLAEKAGDAGAAFVLGSAMLFACLPLLWLFRAGARRLASQPSSVPS
ncbi:MAG: MFS transporter [Alphaproteobacteria bacterium]|jgi:MFS family permease